MPPSLLLAQHHRLNTMIHIRFKSSYITSRAILGVMLHPARSQALNGVFDTLEESRNGSLYGLNKGLFRASGAKVFG